MTSTALLLALFTAGAPAMPDGLLAIRVGRAETITQGSIEHAVILIEGDTILAVGQDLPIERGIPILDRPDWVAMPGLVNPHSRAGMDSQAGGSSEPDALASGELFPGQEIFGELLEYGVTTLGLYPAGTGIPGQAVAIRPQGDTVEDMVLQDRVYLKLYLRSSASSKKMLRDGFEEADKHEEKVAKEREKWEKDQEKKKKKSKSKKDDDDKDKEDDAKESSSDVFVPPAMEPDVEPFLQLRDGSLSALIGIRKAGDYLHLLDAIDDEEFAWSLQVPLRNDIDLYEIKDRLGKEELRVVMNPLITLQPNTRRERNLPAELDRAGVKVVLTPRSDSVSGHEAWVKDVGEIVAAGLDRNAALAAMTLEAAEVLGLGERLGSLDKDKTANMIFWDGDPFEPATRLQAVMLDGRFVHGEVDW